MTSDYIRRAMAFFTIIRKEDNKSENGRQMCFDSSVIHSQTICLSIIILINKSDSLLRSTYEYLLLWQTNSSLKIVIATNSPIYAQSTNITLIHSTITLIFLIAIMIPMISPIINP